MIYCVWYPSGGFGHFINAILTLYGEGFIRPKKQLQFASNGNSHNLDLTTPKYFKDCWPGGIEFLKDKNYCVLIDNGIDSDSKQFKYTFPNSKIIQICYSDRSWPVIARTMIEKAMDSSIEKELTVNEWNTYEPWAQREKYFLFLRDHDLRHAWKSTEDNALYLEEIYSDYDEFFNILHSFAKIEWCQDTWIQWKKSNAVYIDPVLIAASIVKDVTAKWSTDLTHINDTWTQAVIYYYIWIHFNIEVPHNAFADFFTNTDQIIELVA